MSSIFKKTKIQTVKPEETVKPEYVDNNEIEYELDKKRKRKMGAVSQLLMQNNTTNDKTTLGA